MNNSELQNQYEQTLNAWENFKEINDRKEYEIKAFGAADSVTESSLNNLHNVMEGLNDKIENLQASISRPTREVKNYTSSDDHKSAFTEYLRKGTDNNLAKYEQKALSVGSESDGGYFVTRDMQHKIADNIANSVSMRRLATIQKISSDAIEILEDYQKMDTGWTSETNIVTDTTTPKISKKIIPVHEMYAQPKATQKLIDDASIDIESWLEDKIAMSFAEMEENAFIKGDGMGKPKGILSYQNGKEWGKIEQIQSGIQGGLNDKSLMKLVYSLGENYASRTSFIMNRQTTHLIRTLKSESGQYLWSPSLQFGAPDTLLGIPVIHSEAMPLPTKDALAIALGDFKSAYMIVDRANVKVMRDPFTEKPFVKFYTTKRVGGDVVNFSAIKLLSLV
ncbi:MAG: phage major capsid protein [Alphaproteobacteria bacterium]|nr:phage major capsid protein [Alphaproteobacteria bacterium]